jgi:hypothetical protein
MTNKFTGFTLKNVYAYTSAGHYFKMDNVLVNVDKQKLIYCNYELVTPKDTNTSGVSCKILDIPMTVLENGAVEISHHTLVHKLNSGHYRKVDYDDVVLEFNRDFSIFI